MSGLDRIDRAVEEALQRLGLGDARLMLEVIDQWEELAGEVWGTAGRPVRLEGGDLVVEAVDGGAAALLRYASGELLKRLDERFGEGRVGGIRVRVGRGPGR